MRTITVSTALVLVAGLLALGGCGTAITTGGGQASVRVVNASMDYAAVDMYLDDKRKIANVGYETGSPYLKVDADKYTTEFTLADASSALASFKQQYLRDDRYTFLAMGRTGGFQVLTLDETAGEASSGKTKVRLVNAATDAGNLDVYLTDATTALVDAAPTFANVSVDTLASEGFVVLDSGTYRLRATAAGSKSDVRLDVAAVSLAGQAVNTIVVTGTTGGVLADAMLLPQGGSASVLKNGKARVRAVVGLDGGTIAAVSVGATPLLAAASIPVLGSYQVVDAGAAAVTLTVDGAPVPVAGVTLSSGSDYTLVYTGAAASPQQALVADVNRLPGAGTFRIRLINAMSALNEPLSLAVNFLPAVSSVGLGSVALSDQINSFTSGRLDVTRVTTSAVLYSLTSLTLDSQGVYTQVMFGSSSAPTGALRKDR
jgi:hypothetical protein